MGNCLTKPSPPSTRMTGQSSARRPKKCRETPATDGHGLAELLSPIDVDVEAHAASLRRLAPKAAESKDDSTPLSVPEPQDYQQETSRKKASPRRLASEATESKDELSSKSGQPQDTQLQPETSRKMVQGQAARQQRQARLRQQHALTVDNILKEFKGVSWETLSGVLQLPFPQRPRIERKYTTEDARKQSGVEFFLQNHPYASWRFLITRLYDHGEYAVAKHLHQYAEKLTDPTLTLENLSKVTTTVSEDTLENVLWVPPSKRREFQQQSSNNGDYKTSLMEYHLKYSHYASWSDASNRLYGEEHYEAAKAAKVFIKGTSEPTLTLHNLTTLLENVEHDWKNIGIFLNFPQSKREEIKQQHTLVHQYSRATWKLYLTDTPQPSWKKVSYALYRCGHVNELQVIQKKYLKGTAENRRQYEEAMRHGRIKLWLSKLLMYGAAGSGKTSTKEWILGNPPPAERTSTPLAMRPMTICRVNFDGDTEEFSKISTLQERKLFLARAMQPTKPEPLPQEKEDTPAPTQSTPSSDASRVTPAVHESTGEVKPSPLDAQPPSGVQVQPDTDGAMSDDEVESKVNAILENLSMNEEMVKIMDHLSSKVSPVVCFRLIQMIDCGGQSPFHEVLPIFMHKLSFYMFVFRLCDELAKHPVVEFFADGKEIGSSFISPQSIKQLLQHCIRCIHSRTLSNATQLGEAQQNSSTELSKILIIGTHFDEAGKSTESLAEKNAKILKILSPLAKEQVIYHNLVENQVVFPSMPWCVENKRR